MSEEIKDVLESLRFKTSIYRDKKKRNLTFNDDEYYSNILIEYIEQLQQENQKLKRVLDEIRDNLQKSIDSINDKLSDKEIRVENGIIVNPINDYRVVRLKAIRMKCKELLKILDKVGNNE